MKKYSKIITAATILAGGFLFSGNASAESAVAVGAKIGILNGVGLEGRAKIADNFYGRFGVNYLPFNYNTNDSQLKYKVKLTLLTTPLMLDYHPFDGSGFRVSAGLAYNGIKMEGKVSPTSNVTIDGNTYTPRELGNIKSTWEYKNKIAPIVSIGYDSSLMNDDSWSFNAEAGLMYAGKSKIKVSASGLAGSDQKAINDLEKDANKGIDTINKYLKFVPLISVGIKFNI